MASVVDICNLALAHFGQDASIDSIDPPDNSAEAEHAARYYPIARDQLLEMGTWTFATRREALSVVTNDRDDWAYRYAVPNECIKARIMLPEGYGDDQSEGVAFEREGDSLYTDEANATLVFTVRITDPTKFTPLFTTTLSWLLASYMSGPIVKDPSGRIQASLYQRAMTELGMAGASNANSTRNRATYVPTAQRVR